MNIVLALAFLFSALLAWQTARHVRAHHPVLVFFGALFVVFALSAAAAPYAASEVVETAQIAVAAFGLWALAQAVMERRAGPSIVIPFVLGVLLVVLALIPPLRSARAIAEESAWAIGTFGAIWSIQRALRRGAEPQLAHLLVLVFTALAATRLGLGRDAGWVPHAFGAAAAILIQAVAFVKKRRAVHAVDVRPEQLRADERVGDLVDMEPAVRGRPTRETREKRSRRQP